MIATVRGGLQRLRAGTGGLPSLSPAFLKSLVPLVLLAVGVTAMVLMVLWHDQSSYKPVFGARQKVPAADMMAVLDAEGIQYRLHPDSGQVLVAENELGRVRMLLAAKGVTAQLPAGLELMDRNDPLGVSQFVQDVRYRRGLEGELAQSILTLDAIDSVRVHLSIARSTSFVATDGEKSSASVVLGLKPGRTLSPEQIAAIINLVAGSVSTLEPARVSLVDQAGNFLSGRVDLKDGFDPQGLSDSARRYQDEARSNVRDLLAPVLGDNNYRVSITAEVDNDRVEETHEKFGEAPHVTSEAVREEQDRSRMALGVPGSLSNRPIALPNAEQGAGAQQGGNAAANAQQGGDNDASSARKNASTRQYAYDRSITQIKRSRGRLQKLNVAVVLNNAAAADPAKGWSEAEIKNIERVLANGLGINAERGDQLVVSALNFSPRPQEAAWWAQRDNIVDAGSWLLYAVGGLLAFLFVLRPLTQAARERIAPAPVAAAGTDDDIPVRDAVPDAVTPRIEGDAQMSPAALALEGGAPAHGSPVVSLLENYDLPPPGSPVDVLVDHLKVLAGKEPERVAEVVKQWVQKNGRTEQPAE
ncbi:flagellar basal-body MS-ring/collar protein FliF [Methyloversatilis thermotolerans]|uniref:flagellar basal-body MS-ring/collar protein FliF n=1 Tax=Methyloversatilis thermotolerans TaxID=1346290 RepID=UPI000374F35C|nr:flagellar basal-body MS-ring/collar protein FliF [Methyloversatilis thermotolerans]